MALSVKQTAVLELLAADREAFLYFSHSPDYAGPCNVFVLYAPSADLNALPEALTNADFQAIQPFLHHCEGAAVSRKFEAWRPLPGKAWRK